MRVEMLSTRTPPMVCMSSAEKGPSTKRARVTLAWKGMGLLLHLLPLVAVPFFLEDLETPDLFGGNVAPGNAEVCRVELQLQQPLKQAASIGVAPGVVEVVELAMCAAVDGELPATALRAGTRRVGVVHRAHQAALAAGDVVGVGAATRTIGAAIAQLGRAHRPEDQQPERDRPGPLVWC